MQQLPLGVQLRLSSRFDTFQPSGNEAVVEALARLTRAPGQPPIWLAGPQGAGKTHLLQAACAAGGEAGAAVAYLPLAECAGPGPGVLAGLEQLDCVLLDDVEHLVGNAGWENALFRLFIELQDRGGRLVLAAQVAPASCEFRLADLASRLRASLVHAVHPLCEAQQPEALLRRARLRGLELPPDTLSWLVRRAPRDFSALCRLLDELDLAALAAQRRLTIPFVRSVLGDYD
jgi:DnaA-homolog protein